jgi:hypothetical protein
MQTATFKEWNLTALEVEPNSGEIAMVVESAKEKNSATHN